MPPKKAVGPSKAELKKKQKVAEDKTFGLKNKNKSAKVNRYVQQVQQQAAQASQTKKDDKKRKQEEEDRKAELAQLFKPVVVQQKAVAGVDPKSIVCQFFKQGMCSKGNKCKFSHDMSVERKSAKIDIYTDIRGGGGDKPEDDNMEDWDQNKLEQVVTKKHGVGIRTTTEIVCKYFLEAIEQKKYGWFWECPNGGDSCKYRHALPPGYVLKSKAAKADDEDGEEGKITLEEFLETERHNLGQNLTPITLESFTEWKKKRKEREAAEAAAKSKDREAQFKAGKLVASGKELFVYNPDLFRDDDNARDDIDYNARIESDSEDEDGKTAGIPTIQEDLYDVDNLESLEDLTID